MAFFTESRQLVVECQLPSQEVVPAVSEYRSSTTKKAHASDVRELYRQVVAAVALRTIHSILSSDSVGLLHALDVDLKVQQELLRHADIRTTMNIYTHAIPAALREANSKVVRLVLPAQVA